MYGIILPKLKNGKLNDYILLQRTRDGNIVIQAVGVRENMRRKGIATKMIRAVESLGSRKVTIQAIADEKMYKLAIDLGYEREYPDSENFIKRGNLADIPFLK